MLSLRHIFDLALRTIFIFLGLLAIFAGIARVAAPFPFPGESTQRAEEAVAIVMLQNVHRTGGYIFVSMDGRDPDENFMRKLQVSVPGVKLRPISLRTSENDNCAGGSDKLVITGACQFDDFVRIDFLTMPLWRTVVIRATTAACGSEFTLVQGIERWHVASRRGLCS